MPTVVSLFSGCGGSDAGVLRAGFEVLMANDILPYARDVYLANHPETDYVLGDVSSIESFPSADLLVGCYPCQGFSQGGVRKADRKINTLYLEFARALRIVKPKAFIVENVSGMVRSNFEHLLQDQFKVFEEAGYRVKSQILNASHYGVAQNRKRIFIVGIRSDFDIDYEFPLATHGDNLKPYTTIRDAIGHLPEWPMVSFTIQIFIGIICQEIVGKTGRRFLRRLSNPRHMPLHP
jgi:DNA (cytosine-5)-methyltransferase 1